MSRFILALDQGTTSSRAILFDRSGQIHGVAQREFKQFFPQPGWVEHNPMDIWESQKRVMEAVTSGIAPEEIAAIGITNQRETTLLWDRKTGKPLGPAIVWQDRRTAFICDELRDYGLLSLFREKTGLLLDPYFSGTKLRWMLDTWPDIRPRAEAGELAFGTVDTWLLWNLTDGKVHATDATNASRTLLYNLHTGQWDDELLDLLKIPHALLPEIRTNGEVFGHTGLLGGFTPIAGIAGDQQAALFGQACHRKGMAKNTYGTGCFMLMNTGETPVVSENNLITTVAWEMNGCRTYALEGSVFIAGAVVQWLRDGLGIIQTSGEVEQLAAEVSDTEGVYLVPAFAGLGAPYWDPYARGTITGLTRGTKAAHLARAALESMAHQTCDLLEAMQADAGFALEELRVDGGATANNLLLQIQADLLQKPVIRPIVTETTALGAAFLAGLTVRFWRNTDEIAELWATDRRFIPIASPQKVAESRVGWAKAIGRSQNWTN
ncbi:MAG: glycerol kinase GlpK [Bacteroidetes Order II. Incertae sedis bacterium]|nr:glycerol kinase GlpK [Bacteroidetes Order II. bacterium]